MKKYNIFRFAFILCAGLAAQACSDSDENITPGAESNQTMTVSISDSGIVSELPSRAATSSTYVTTFTDGDQIGIFGVKDGAVITGVENVCLTFDGSAWSSIALNKDQDYSSVTYYAYYPYYSSAADDFDAGAADPFSVLVSSWTIGLDQSGDNYTAYDLMTGSATAVQNGRNYTLDLVFDHEMSLAVIGLPSVTYNFTNTDVTLMPYSIAIEDAVFNVDVNSSGSTETFTPYYDAETGLYRLLIKPGDSYDFSGSFGAKTYTGLSISSATVKTYYTRTVDGGPQVNSHHLKVGDRFYSDGTLESVDVSPATTADCIGIVAYVGNYMPSVLYPDEYGQSVDLMLNEHPSCTHGIVVSLDEGSAATTQFMTSNGSGANINNWWLTSSLYGSSISVLGDRVEPCLGRDQFLGYNNTRIIEEFTTSVGTTFAVTGMENLSAYRTANAAPGVTTDWYIPSSYELRSLALNDDTALAAINTEISNAGGLAINMANYWSSTEYGQKYMFYVTFASGAKATTTHGGDKKEQTYLNRYMLAF